MTDEGWIYGYRGEKWGRIVARCYITERTRCEHYAYKHHGWGIELDVYEQIVCLGVKTIIVRVSEGNRRYDLVSDINSWKLYGVVDRLREDFKRQIFLAEKHMRREKVGTTAL